MPSLDLVRTTGVTLGTVRDELVIAGAGSESRLREALWVVSGDYDLILIDCAPRRDQLTSNGRAWDDDLSDAATARGLCNLTPSIPKRVLIADTVEASRGLDEWGVERRPPSPPSTPTTSPPSKDHAHERPTRTPPIQPHRIEPDRAADP
ncbi:ParA family protein [Frigoribacterium sp. R86507]|uniref:ParA family protein n=1 Tax=Frigoribacterium sp. R86507 TaxID=3093850 RepID=UPI0037C7729B